MNKIKQKAINTALEQIKTERKYKEEKRKAFQVSRAAHTHICIYILIYKLAYIYTYIYLHMCINI